MRCRKCGKKLEDSYSFCTGCGARQTGSDEAEIRAAIDNEGLEESVNRYMNGDEKAFDLIYAKAHRYRYYMIMSRK